MVLVKTLKPAAQLFRPGMRLGPWTLLERLPVGSVDHNTRFRARCTCGTEQTVFPSRIVQLMRSDTLMHGCRECWRRARVLPYLCARCGTQEPARFRHTPDGEPRRKTKCMQCLKCEGAGL